MGVSVGVSSRVSRSAIVGVDLEDHNEEYKYVNWLYPT